MDAEAPHVSNVELHQDDIKHFVNDPHSYESCYRGASSMSVTVTKLAPSSFSRRYSITSQRPCVYPPSTRPLSSCLTLKAQHFNKGGFSSRRKDERQIRLSDSLSRSVTAPCTIQKRWSTSRVESSQHPLSGLYKPTHLQRLYYGSGSVKKHLLECLPNESSKAFIVTGTSLANKTDLVKQVEELLGSKHHAATYSKIGQHAPVKQLDEATDLVLKDESVDTIISIGGGSPIDSAKAISYRLNERKAGKFLYHITIPTTLSAAECTIAAGYTNEDGIKTGVANPNIAVHAILYDAKYMLETPSWLLMSTAMRSMDHAMELMYHPTSTEMPCRALALWAAGELFTHLPMYKANPKDEQIITKLQLAAFASLGFIGLNLKGGLGLSHGLGYALGSPYGIPHGITSCLTLGHVIKLKAEMSAYDATQIARMAPFIGISKSGDEQKDAVAVGDAILDLVKRLDLKTTLTEKNVGKDQVPVITKRATGQESGELHDKVKALVEGLY